MLHTDLIPGLFRSEHQKICSVLCKFLGLERIDIAEDLAGETFLAALETWPYQGVPANPTAWLYAVAKNKAKNYLVRNNLFTTKIAGELSKLASDVINVEPDLSQQNINDSQLQMLFAICTPVITPEAQVGLALRILCGFGIDEIATAFMSNKETINKRLYRAKEKLRSNNVSIAVPGPTAIAARLDAVLKVLYLLFNEGYYSESGNELIRKDFCEEAIRLTILLLENEDTNLPKVRALMALMCFQSSRFAARTSLSGDTILYDDQDEEHWNHELIQRGVYWLHKASEGDSYSTYHLEATIAFWHTSKEDSPEKWENILQLYNKLLQLAYSPVAALNRTYALSKARSVNVALDEALKLGLDDNRFYHALLGELYTSVDIKRAIRHFQLAISLSERDAEIQSLLKKINKISSQPLTS